MFTITVNSPPTKSFSPYSQRSCHNSPALTQSLAPTIHCVHKVVQWEYCWSGCCSETVCPRRLKFSQFWWLMITTNGENFSLLGQTVSEQQPLQQYSHCTTLWTHGRMKLQNFKKIPLPLKSTPNFLKNTLRALNIHLQPWKILLELGNIFLGHRKIPPGSRKLLLSLQNTLKILLELFKPL